MPGHKKRKLNSTSYNHPPKSHHQNDNDETDLSHAEIWDDSALIRSWNDAYAEYEYYHSIHARGEDVEEVLRRAELGDDVERNGLGTGMGTEGQFEGGEGGREVEDDGGDQSKDGGAVNSEEGEAPKLNGSAVYSESETISVLEKEKRASGEQAEAMKGVNLRPVQPTLSEEISPETIATSTADQTLENIKMAYYWAGYYSGLYDGQQQQQASNSR